MHFLETVDALSSGELNPNEFSTDMLFDQGDNGENLVHYFLTVEADVKTAAALLELGVPFDEYSDLGVTPLMDCASIGLMSSARFLLERGADPNKRTLRDGETALHFAARSGRRAAYNLLVKFGADPEIENQMGETPEQLLG